MARQCPVLLDMMLSLPGYCFIYSNRVSAKIQEQKVRADADYANYLILLVKFGSTLVVSNSRWRIRFFCGISS